jgi:hypothetical protein
VGGFIKVTLRESNRLTTNILTTSVLDKLLANFQNIFDNDIADQIIAEGGKEQLVSTYHDQVEVLAPFSYGYLFIDRIKKKVFFLNDYNAATFFSNFNFTHEIYRKLKKQVFQVNIQSDYDSASNSFKSTETFDARKEFVMKDLIPYLKLGTAVPYIEEITSIDRKISNVSSIETILDELFSLRELRNSDPSEYINDLIISKFKEWEFIEDNSTKKSYSNLFGYLKSENMLSKNDIEIWEKEIAEASE